jgi:hypothetical protein
MNDHALRIAVKRKLFRRYQNDSDTLIIDELGVNFGASRIDIAVVNGSMHGYELKSDRDSLVRLPDQIRAYNSVFDRVTLVVGYKLAYKALMEVPDWWGVTLASAGPQGGIRFEPARKPNENPTVDILSVVRLLWRDEALALLATVGATHGMQSKPKALIYQVLISTIEPLELKAMVRHQLRSRIDWRSDQSQMSDDD